MKEITELMGDWHEGRNEALNEIMEKPEVMEHLRQMAQYRLAGERANHTLGKTALVNELYVKFSGEHLAGWDNRAAFFAAASRRMRQILIDYARKRKVRPQGKTCIPLDLLDDPKDMRHRSPVSVLELNQVLETIARTHPRRARLIELRVFGGLTHDQVAEIFQMDSRHVRRLWNFAKTSLVRQLKLKPTA